MTSQPNDDRDNRRAALSALMDGDPLGADQTCGAWRSNAQLRADWHAYHVIGDVMRSEEHHCDAARDAQMLARLRERLAAEPVVLAPAPLVARPDVRRRGVRAWLAPAAMAAGFAAVAGVVVVTRMASEQGSGAAGGQLAAGAAAPVVVIAAPGLAASTSVPESVPMIRNAELDRYLAAHRQYANGAAQVSPGGVVRNAAMTAPGR
jgi:sigma-E factor negative regulatory protein RseA